MRLTSVSVLILGSLLAASAYAASPSNEPSSQPAVAAISETDASQAAEPLESSDVAVSVAEDVDQADCIEGVEEELFICEETNTPQYCEALLEPAYEACFNLPAEC